MSNEAFAKLRLEARDAKGELVRAVTWEADPATRVLRPSGNPRA